MIAWLSSSQAAELYNLFVTYQLQNLLYVMYVLPRMVQELALYLFDASSFYKVCQGTCKCLLPASRLSIRLEHLLWI